MKTMTCRQLGGPCDFAMHGNTADDVIQEGERHIRERVAAGDETHRPAMEIMDSMRRDPASGMEWYRNAQDEFSKLPEE